MQECVSIYEICECDIGTLDIHRVPRVDRLSMGPPGFGASHYVWILKILEYFRKILKYSFFLLNYGFF